MESSNRMVDGLPFREVSFADWRALVEKELAGKSFDKTLVHDALAGVPVMPLYAEAPPVDPAARYERSESFRICMRHGAGATVEQLKEDVSGGADALWLPLERAVSLGGEAPENTRYVLEASAVPSSPPSQASVQAIAVDPIAWRAAGRQPLATLAADLAALGKYARETRTTLPLVPTVFVSTVPYHDAGADAADELAIALGAGVRYIEALVAAGMSPAEAIESIALRVAVGRDTFVELCKVRALRVVWAKIASAYGVSSSRPPLVHAVCSSPTLTVRDPWVNMLRVTTQVFAAVIGGADLVTPASFDEASGEPSAHGRRVARNTGLVLREESALGKVSDAAAGSYYFDTLTDALAREGWKRFQKLTTEGGITAAIESGRLRQELEARWKDRLDRIAKRKTPILGVSEFANLDEKLPRAGAAAPSANALLPAHRDAAAFEELRARAESCTPAPEALLVTLGTFAESRPRVGFTANFLAAGGVRSRETTSDERATVAVLCGTDERYAAEAATRARSLKALGVKRVLLAGRPGALEASLREAGVDGFLFVGSDAVAVLTEIVATYSANASEAS